MTYGHHSVIQGKRNGALYGSIATILLAVIFTGFQGVEYSVSSFTISDGIFGTCFFFGTGFHGLMWCVALCIYFLTLNYGSVATNIIINLPIGNINAHLKKLSTTNNLLQFNKETFGSINLKKEFLEWFIGFIDGEGNFNIKITGLEENTFKNLQLTFQIGLHKDEIKTLEFIKNTLKCGHISQSNNRINYFVNDINSLVNILLPVFDNVNLNSSKYHFYLLFKKATFLVANKLYFTENGKLVPAAAAASLQQQPHSTGKKFLFIFKIICCQVYIVWYNI